MTDHQHVRIHGHVKTSLTDASCYGGVGNVDWGDHAAVLLTDGSE